MPTYPEFALFAPTIRFPGCGDMDFRYAPYTKWEAPAAYRGDERVEMRAFTEVASPGKQLGKLTEVVLKIAEANNINTKEVQDLTGYCKSIDEIKNSVEDRTERDFKEFADKLANQNPRLLRTVLEEYRTKLSDAED